MWLGWGGASSSAGDLWPFQVWRFEVARDLGRRAGIRDIVLLDIEGPLQHLSASQLRERVEMLLRGILTCGVWNGFLLGFARREIILC